MNPQQYTAAILALGLKQRELAAMIPCSASLISSIACGARGKNTAYWIVERLAAILKNLSELKNSTPTKKVKK